MDLEIDVRVTVEMRLPSGGELGLSRRVPAEHALDFLDKTTQYLDALEEPTAAEASAAPEPPPAPATVTPIKRAQRVSKPAAESTGDFACAECDASFDRPQSLGRHRAHKHGYRAAKPAKASTPPDPGTPTVGGKPIAVLRCDDCSFHALPDQFARMRSHTMSQHGGRLPTTRESTPRIESSKEASA